MRKLKLLLLAFMAMLVSSVNAVDYEIDQKLTSIGDLDGKLFAILNEDESKAFYLNTQDLAYGDYSDAWAGKAYFFSIEAAANGHYYIHTLTPTGAIHAPYGGGGYLNSQPANGSVCFTLGITAKTEGTDIAYGAVWDIEESGGKFALKNIGTDLYLKDAAPAKYADPTYFTFCTIKETEASKVARYQVRYGEVKASILSIKSDLDISAAEALAASATTSDDVLAAISSLYSSLNSYLAGISNDKIDITAAYIKNASPGTAGNIDYWTNSSNPGLQANLYEFYNIANATTKQTIEAELPAGYYTLTVVGYTREGYNGYIFAGEGNTQTLVGVAKSTVNNRSQGNSWIAEGNGNGVNEFTFQLASATSNLEIGINSGTEGDKWTCWRSFKLEYLGTAPLAKFQADLAAAVSTANDHATALDGTIPAGALTTYKNAISSAAATNSTTDECLQSIKDIEDATKEADACVILFANYNTLNTAVQALYDVANYEELTSGSHATLGTSITTAATNITSAATATEIETVISTLKNAGKTYAGAADPTGDAKFDLTFLLTNPDITGYSWTKLDGWYTDQKFNSQNSQAMYTEGEGYYYEYWSNNNNATEGFTVYLNPTLPEGTYRMTAKCKAGWGGGATNPGGTQAITFSAGTTSGSVITSSTLADAQLDFVQPADGEIKLGLEAHEGNTCNWMGIGYVQLFKVPAVTVTIDEDVAYTPESKAGKVTLKRTLSTEKWNTFVVPFQITNDELKAAFGDEVAVAEYSETPDGDNSEVSFTVMGTPAITANTPVLLKPASVDAGNTYVFENRTIATGDAKVAGTNFDFVGIYASATIGADNYFISANKLYKSSGATTIKGTRAFIAAKDPGAHVANFYIDGIETTAIEGLEISNINSGKIYNLNGQEVKNAQKGIYIMNGKKVIK